MPVPCGFHYAFGHRAASSPASSPLPRFLTLLIHGHRIDVRTVVARDRVEVAEVDPVFGLCVWRDEVDQGGGFGDEVSAAQYREWRWLRLPIG